MGTKKTGIYNFLVYVAYACFIAFGALWFIVTLVTSSQFNYIALITMVIFAAGVFLRNNLANLIIGIATWFVSVFFLLEGINELCSKDHDLHVAGEILTGISITCIMMSLILIFSFLMLNKKLLFE